MTDQGPGWEESKLLARGILRDRRARRRWMAGLLGVPVAMVVLGLWLIDGWLAASQGRFLAWWAFCALATGLVLMFALYDALAVIQEERARQRRR